MLKALKNQNHKILKLNHHLRKSNFQNQAKSQKSLNKIIKQYKMKFMIKNILNNQIKLEEFL